MKTFIEWVIAGLLLLLGLLGGICLIAVVLALPSLVVGFALWVLLSLCSVHTAFWKLWLGTWAGMCIVGAARKLLTNK